MPSRVPTGAGRRGSRRPTTPSRLSCETSLSAPRLVRTNTIVRDTPSEIAASTLMRSSSCTFKKRCSMSSTSCFLRHDLVHHRVVHVAAHQHVDLAVERGREQQRLTVVRDLAHDPFDLRQEAHVGHAVGLVDDEDADLVEVELAPLEEVDQSARVSRRRLRSGARGCGSGGPSKCRRRTRRRARRSACRSGSARRRPAWRARASARARVRSGGPASMPAWSGWRGGRRRASCPTRSWPCRRRRGRRARLRW